MGDLVPFLKSYGVPVWAIVALVALGLAVRPLLALIQRVRAAPTLERLIELQIEKADEQHTEIYADMRAELAQSRAETAESKEATRKAYKALRASEIALRDCQRDHTECRAELTALIASSADRERRIVELERHRAELEKVAGYVREPGQ